MNFESTSKNKIIYDLSEKRTTPWTFVELDTPDKDGDKQGNNETVMRHILDRNIPSETQALLDFYQANNILVTRELLDQIRPFEQQRFQIHRQMTDKIYECDENKPEKSEFEKKLGIYLKNIEPQVRQAIINISTKGYQTIYSGFEFGGRQTIWCRGDVFANYQPSEQLLGQLKDRNIELKIEPSKINFQPKEVLDISELEKAWLQIVADLPILNSSI